MNDELPLPDPTVHEDGDWRIEYYTATQVRETIKQAVEAEREACAKVCDDLHPGLATKRAAEIIRARSQS